MPKPMATVAGRPFLEILLDRLIERGISRVIFAVGYKADCISTHFGDQYRSAILDYSIETNPLGTGGAVRKALSKCSGEYALILNGDTYLDVDYKLVESVYLKERRPTLVLRNAMVAEGRGVVQLEGERIVSFTEKPTRNGPSLISAGVYLFPVNVLNHFEHGRPFSLETDYFEAIAPQGALRGIVCDGRFVDIGKPEDYHIAQTLLAST